jgi:AraC family transcriptional regulator
VAPTITPLLSAPSLTLSRFRCPPDVPSWDRSTTIGPLAHVVFPERPVSITRASTGPQIGDRNWALLYAPDEEYTRELVDPQGDECTFVALSAELLDDLVSSTPSAPQTFGAGRVLVGTPTWLAYQHCLSAAERVTAAGQVLDPLDLESRLLTVLSSVLQDPALTEPTKALHGDARTRRASDRRVHEACRLLATRLDERLTISAVASAVGLSAYHFCRVFRATTGLTVHAYRERLRLRQAFATCATTPSRKLAEIAMSTGYASHSHMTTSFRASLQTSPSAVRDRYARGVAEAGRLEPFSFR